MCDGRWRRRLIRDQKIRISDPVLSIVQQLTIKYEMDWAKNNIKPL